VVLAHAFLQHLAEVFPDLGVVVLAVLGEVIQQVQGLAHAAVADHLHVPGLLQDFPGDVEGQVGGIDDAADEAQVGGHQLARVLHDEHPLHVELHAGLGIPVPQVEGGVGGHVEQGGVILAAFHLDVGPGQGILVVVAHVLVEGLVFVLGDVVLGAGPEGVGPVGGLRLAFLVGKFHRDGDMVGILADDGFDAPVVEELGLVILQAQHDLGAPVGFFHRLQAVLAAAFFTLLAVHGAFPAHAMLLGEAGAAGGERHLVGDDEAGIEADAELADELGVLLLVAGELAEEFPGAGLGDGADVLDHLLAAHADAVVADGDGPGVLVHAHPDLQLGVLLEQGRVGQGLEAQLVGGVAGIGNQFPEEDFLVAV
jgi:hypothetical protein